MIMVITDTKGKLKRNDLYNSLKVGSILDLKFLVTGKSDMDVEKRQKLNYMTYTVKVIQKTPNFIVFGFKYDTDEFGNDKYYNESFSKMSFLSNTMTRVK